MARASFKLEVDFGGPASELALDLQVTMTPTTDPGGAYSWLGFSSNTSLAIPSTYYLLYDMWVSPTATNANQFFDLWTATGKLYLTTALDQNGVSAGGTPAGAIGNWHRRRIQLPSSWIGQNVSFYGPALYNATGGAFHVQYRNVWITDSASAIQKSLWVSPNAVPTIAPIEHDASNTHSATVALVAQGWTDVTTALWSFTVNRGRQHELDRTEGGTLTAVLDNRSRAFDPTYSASPYTTGLVPMRPVKLTADLNGTNYPVYYGYVEAWTQLYGLAALPQVELRAADGFKVLGLAGLRGTTFAAENTETRFNNVLAAVGWPSSMQSSTGARSFQASADFTSQDQNALEHLQQAVQAEGGRLFARRDGVIRFDHRHQPYASTTPAYTYDETLIRGLVLEFSDANIWNEIQTQRTGGTLHTTADTATSQARYFKRTLSRTNLPLDDDNEPEDLGGFLLTNYHDPGHRVNSIVIQGEQPTTTYRDAILSRELGDRVVVDYEPRAVSAETINQESFLEGIEVQGARGTLPTFTFRLSPIGIAFTLGTPWTLSTATDSTNGVIGTNTVLRY